GARPVASLAADPLGQRARDALVAPVAVARVLRQRGIGVVAEEAFVPRAAEDAFVVAAVVARRHPPLLRLRVPRERKLIELAVRHLVEVGARVVARAEDPVDRLL